MKTTNTKNRTPLKITLAAVAILLLATGGWLAYAYASTTWPFSSSNSSLNTNESEGGEGTINYDPPTEQETKESQDAKERIQQENEKPNNTDKEDETSDKKNVNVGIAFADIVDSNLEIRAFTPSIIAGDGICTATVSKAGHSTITKTSNAFIDATSTICEPINIPKSQLSAGTWTINVTYTSPKYTGSSGPIKVNV
jgi:hypothetical protein